MPSTSETGHAKNVANFEDLISFCTAYGVSYKPSKISLTLPKLTELQTAAQKSLQQTKTAKTGFDNATNKRQLAFKDLKTLSTKIVNALAVSGAAAGIVNDAKAINRKIQGAKAEAGNTSQKEGTEQNKTISTSQQSYDSLIDHFAKLIETVTQESNYKPNEVDLKTATLQVKLNDLKTSNTNLVNSYTKWSNAMISRDGVLYNILSGLVPTALEVKKYVKSVFGASSPQFKQVNGIQFKTIKE